MLLHLANPAQLWLLAAVLPVWLLLRRIRNRPQPVASLELWRRALRLDLARPPRRLWDWEALCALAVPVLLAAGLADPLWVRPAAGPTRLMVVVDNSPSMLSRRRDGSGAAYPSRLEQAAAWLKKIGQRYPDLRFALQTAGGIRLGNGLTAEAAAAGVVDLTGDEVRDDPREQAALAALQNWARAEDVPVLWLADREPPRIAGPLAIILVGDATGNVGLLAAGVNSKSADFFANLGNFSAAPRVCYLRAVQAGIELARGSLRLPAGGSQTYGFAPVGSARYDPSRSVSIELWHPPASFEPDDFAPDDRVELPPAIRTAAAADDLPDRVKLALTAAAGLTLRPAAEGDSCQLAVAGGQPSVRPQQGLLLLGPTAPGAGLVALAERVKATAFQAADFPSEALGGLKQAEFSTPILPPDARVLVTAGAVGSAGAIRVPFVAVWTWQNLSVAYLAALPADWTADPGFALAMIELVERLLPSPRPLPGLAESDNRLPGPATGEMPVFNAPEKSLPAAPLGAWLIWAALAALVALAAAEGRRTLIAVLHSRHGN